MTGAVEKNLFLLLPPSLFFERRKWEGAELNGSDAT